MGFAVELRWKVEIGGGYAGPAVADGRVFVLDRQLAKGTSNPSNPFSRGQLPGTERVLCLNEVDGKLLWKHEYDCPYAISYPAGPRCTPTVDGDRVYVLGAMGDLFCFKAKTGKLVWKKDFKKDFGAKVPIWGFAAHPLVEGNKLICLVGGNRGVAMAFDKMTGKVLWSALQSPDLGYCPPMIYEAGGKRQLIIWHPRALNSVDPETGKLYWSVPFTARSGLTIPTPRLYGDLLFVTSFYNGPLMMRLAKDVPRAGDGWMFRQAYLGRADAFGWCCRRAGGHPRACPCATGRPGQTPRPMSAASRSSRGTGRAAMSPMVSSPASVIGDAVPWPPPWPMTAII